MLEVVPKTEDALGDEGVTDNKDFNWENAKKVFSCVGFLQINLVVVYFLEYTITTSFTIACGQ